MCVSVLATSWSLFYISGDVMQGPGLGMCAGEASPPGDSDLESGDISVCPQEGRTSSFDLPTAQGGRDLEGKVL